MNRKMLFPTIRMLCIVHLSSSMTTIATFDTTTNTPETWSNNFTEFTEDIDLSHLEIETLHESTFTKCAALNELNLSSNNLKSTQNVVAALRTVSPLILNLSRNNLGSLEYDRPTYYDDRSYKQWKTILLGSKYFWSVDLSYNFLLGIGIDFDVMHLNLSNNLILCHNAIESRRFYGKPIYVGNLDLSHNLINCQTLFFTTNIDTLDMSYNNLKSLDADGLLRGLVLLTKLNLNHNDIRYIHPRAFENTFRLQNLYLQSNQIRTIYKQVWTPLHAIKTIDLSSNRLEYLEWDIVMTSEQKFTPEVNVGNNVNVRISSSSNNFKFCNGYVSLFESRMVCSPIDTDKRIE